MNRALTVDDLVLAGIALGAGLLAAFLLRVLMRWLGKHADRTRWPQDYRDNRTQRLSKI